MRRLTFGIASVLFFLAGCGASVTTGGAGGAGSTGGAGGQATSGCPAAEPSGGACAPEGRRCTYGDSVRPECRDAWSCDHGAWAGSTSVCAMSTTCGSSQPADGTVCPIDGAACSYGDTICICSQCPGGPCMMPPATWTCAPPPTGPGCPAVVPNDGTACGMEGVSCTYGFVCGGSGAEVQCTGGLWVWAEAITCPD